MTSVGIIQPCSGTALRMRKGQFLKVISPLGEQVSDLLAVSADNHASVFSANKTLDYAETINITTGNILYSCIDEPLMEIVQDKNGQNDCLLAPCSPGTFKHFYNKEDGRIGCLGNLRKAFSAEGVNPDLITSTFNIFMNVQINRAGKIEVLPPKSKPKDYMILWALTDLIVGLTACSAEMSNNNSFKPIEYMVLDENYGH